MSIVSELYLYCKLANKWREKYRIFRNGRRAERANFLKWQESAKYRNLEMAEKSLPFIRKLTVSNSDNAMTSWTPMTELVLSTYIDSSERFRSA